MKNLFLVLLGLAGAALMSYVSEGVLWMGALKGNVRAPLVVVGSGSWCLYQERERGGGDMRSVFRIRRVYT